MSSFDAARDELGQLRTLARATRYDPANRLALLAVHVAFGLVVGACFWIWGVPAGWQALTDDTPAANAVIATTPIAGASLLATGLAMGRNLALEAAGMATMLTWEILGIVAVIRWITVDDPGPLQYQVAFYGAPALLMIVHLATLVAYLRDQHHDRRHDRPAARG